MPEAEFSNGTHAEEVVIEYDAGEDGSNNDWPRLISQRFACGPPGVAGDSWLKDQHPSIPEMWVDAFGDAAQSTSTIRGVRCYVYRATYDLEPGTQVIMEFDLDCRTCEPVRQTKTVVQKGVTTRDQTDYILIEHLAGDPGIDWRLDAAQFRGKKRP